MHFTRSCALVLPLLCALTATTPAAGDAAAGIEEELGALLRAAPTAYNHYRLPSNVLPHSYDLQIITHLDDPKDLRFTGLVGIHLRALVDTHNITLHAKNLSIAEKQITLTGGGDGAAANCVLETEVNEYHDYYTMHLCQPLRKGGEYVLGVPFTAPLSERLHGYYKSSYHDKASNRTRWLSITQFEPTSARSAFPCFDEPSLKAKFRVTLGHHKQYTALSNMPLKQSKPMADQADWMWSEFEESVPMSTYLLAYTVHDFAHTTSETANLRSKVLFRTWARRDAIAQCDYAGVVGPKVLQFFEEIFNVKFPLPKMDQIAVPDFSSGAMENWGLITYRETALLYADKVSSQSQKQTVASVIAHELAHQWFGNLVTMKWWTDLWLNEGFATYVASLGIEHISPEWSAYVEESVENIITIFRTDALKSSHPISQPIEHASEIFQIFDSISYKKGSTVLRMMHLFLGDEAFRDGIYEYLKKYAYSNAEQDNLWASLTESALKHRTIPAGFAIKRIMDSWTLQTGYPVLTVTRDYDQRTATVTQERYLLDTSASRSAEHSCWWVPLSYTSARDADFNATGAKAWLECDAQNEAVPKTLTDDMPAADDWLLVNLQLSALYKVKYDERNWNLLIATLTSDDFTKIHLVNRAQLIDDALTLAWSGDQDYDIAMRLIEYLAREREYIPWKAALENLGSVNHILRQTPEYEFFKKYIRKIIAPIYQHLHGLNATTVAPDAKEAAPGKDGAKEAAPSKDGAKETAPGKDGAAAVDHPTPPNHSQLLHKVLIAGWACRFEVDDCVARAQAYFGAWRAEAQPDEQNPVPSDFRSVVYCTAMRHGGDDDWQFLWQRYKNSNVAAEKKTIITALGCTREVWLLQRYLEWAFDPTSHIRKQDSSYAFGSVARGEVGYHLAKDYFLSNIEFLYSFYEPESSDLVRLLAPLASQMTTRRDYDTMKAFTTQHQKLLAKADQGVRRALETIQINAQWKERNYREIARHLKQRLSAETPA